MVRPSQGEVGKLYKAVYHGESGYSAYHRGLGHLEGMERKTEEETMLCGDTPFSTMGGEADFSMSILATHPTVVARKLQEGCDIVSAERDILLNSKLEFLQGAVPHTRRQWGM